MPTASDLNRLRYHWRVCWGSDDGYAEESVRGFSGPERERLQRRGWHFLT